MRSNMGFQGSMQANENLKTDFRCTNCGVHVGFTKKLFCSNCATAAQRKEMFNQNEIIKAENRVKGLYGNR